MERVFFDLPEEYREGQLKVHKRGGEPRQAGCRDSPEVKRGILKNDMVSGGFYKCALSDFEIVFEDKLKVVEGA